ncbi:MAG: N-acetylmuramoyl-L-alanine amidase [Oscillibacter sp.]
MSKYALKVYPQKEWKFRVYDNIRKLEPKEIVKETGCADLVNLGYFALKDYPGGKAFSHQCAVMIGGKWVNPPQWDWPGICVSANGTATIGGTKDAVCDYVASVQADYTDNQQTNTKRWPKNGVTYTGFLADGTLVAMIATKDDGVNSEEAINIMRDAGCVTIMRWDGSWSSRGRIGGKYITPSQHRTDRTYLLITPRGKKEEPVMPAKKKVCIDPGHGAGSVNCSPDKSYWEHEFAWNLYERMKPVFERCGIEVAVTRRKDNKPELTERVKFSNKFKPDLFVSLHSNAMAGGWGIARGLLCFTYKAGDNEGQNKAAQCILKAMKDAGVVVHGEGLRYDGDLTVLRDTYAPAVLIEYGFHTNKDDVSLLKDGAYRENLAEYTVNGICDYLGVKFVPAPAETAPWYDESRKWAMEHGITDGTRPEDKTTRAEVWEMLRRYAAGKDGRK